MKAAGEAAGWAFLFGSVSLAIFKLGSDLKSVPIPSGFLWAAFGVSASVGGLLSFSDVLKRKRQLATKHFERGNEAYNRREYDLAIDEYSEAIRLRPKYAEAYVNRGVARKMQGDYDSAIKDHSEAIRLKPRAQLEMAIRSRGIAYYARGDYDLASADLTEALRLDPTQTVAFLCRGLVNRRKKAYDEAIADFTDAIHLNPEDPEPFRNRAFCYTQKQEFERAFSDFGEAIRLELTNHPCRGHAYYQRGRRGEYHNAIEELRKAVEANPANIQATNLLAWVLATCKEDSLRNSAAAVQLARKACELSNWQDANYLDTLAAAYAECGSFQEAVDWQKSAIELCRNEGQIQEFQDRLRLYEQRMVWLSLQDSEL